MQGAQLLETLRTFPADASAAIFLRHAERHPILSASSPTLAELTPAGVAAAEAFGRRLDGFDVVRLFHSPVKRCRQTAEAIGRGAQAIGRATVLVGAEKAIGIDYIVDLPESGRLTEMHGEHFVRLWIDGQIAPAVVRPAEELAAEQTRFIGGRLFEPATGGRRLDVHVSHDWNILTVRELVCGVRLEEGGWLGFLDGVAFGPVPGGLRAVYRDQAVVGGLPWRFAGAKRAQG